MSPREEKARSPDRPFVREHVMSGEEEKKEGKKDPLDRGGTRVQNRDVPRSERTRERARAGSHVRESGRCEGIKPIWWTGTSQSKGQMRRRL